MPSTAAFMSRIARLRLRFDAQTEARFAQQYDRASVSHARWACVAVFFAFLAPALSWGVVPDYVANAFITLGCSSAAVGFAASFVPRIERVFQPMASLLMAVPLGVLMVVIMRPAGSFPETLFGGLLVFQVFCICSVSRLRTRWAAAASLLYLAIVLGAFATRESPDGLGLLVALGFGAFSVGMVATWAMERNARTEWVLLTQADAARAEADNLLQTILPTEIAHRLKGDEQQITDRYSDVSVLFADLVGFTDFASQHESSRVVSVLNEIYSRFDRLAATHGVEKIKTIGDSYMAAAGMTGPGGHADAVCALALDMLTEMQALNASCDVSFQLRAGISTGPVVAGVIGEAKPAYDIWGDTVNVASRMESLSAPGQVTVSETTYRALSPGSRCVPGGTRPVKGKGMMPVYVLVGSA